MHELNKKKNSLNLSSEELVKNLNYISCRTEKVFDLYGISTRNVPAKNLYSVIDIEERRLIHSAMTKKMCND